MKIVGISIAALIAAVGAAQAADLPTKKGPPAAPAGASCFSSLYNYFDSTPASCPLTWNGITLYGTIDMGVGYETHGVDFNRQYPTGVEELISKNSQGAKFGLTPNGISQSQVGVKVNEPLASGWSFVGNVATGFDPYTLQLSNGPGAMGENTSLALPFQNGNGDSSRAGQWDNSVGYLGLSNTTFGTLTVGRQNSFTLDGVVAYDPMGGSYAFSPIGYSGKTGGAGSTEDARVNTAVKYTVNVGSFRAGALYQFGGYDQGNGANGDVEGTVGANLGNLSVDAIYTYIKDQVNLATYNGPLPLGAPSDALKATLSDNQSVMLLAKYTWGPVKFFGGYEYIRYANPTDPYATGFTALGGLPVIAGAVTSNAYNINAIYNILWTGAKYAVTDQIDVTGAYYRYIQNDYNTSACGPNTTAPAAGYAPQGASSSKCAGNLNAVSAMIDYRPLKRIDLYAGLMYSEVDGGLANGYLHTNNLDPTVGVRVQF